MILWAPEIIFHQLQIQAQFPIKVIQQSRPCTQFHSAAVERTSVKLYFKKAQSTVALWNINWGCCDVVINILKLEF